MGCNANDIEACNANRTELTARMRGCERGGDRGKGIL